MLLGKHKALFLQCLIWDIDPASTCPLHLHKFRPWGQVRMESVNTGKYPCKPRRMSIKTLIILSPLRTQISYCFCFKTWIQYAGMIKSGLLTICSGISHYSLNYNHLEDRCQSFPYLAQDRK